MSSKTIILSSAGLKNVIPKINSEDEFVFIFGNRKMKMNNIFADFISPVVSKIHLSDPMINCIDFTKQIGELSFTDDVLSLIQLLSKGTTIEISDEQIFQIQAIAILLGNDELSSLINEKFDPNINETNIDLYLTNLKVLYQISQTDSYLKYKNTINYIAKHFYSIDENKIISLPLNIIYSIISNENLVIDSEDSLFEFIEKLFSQKDEKEDIISFYEEIEFTKLSESKFNEFIQKFSGSDMTQKLWQKLCNCFYTNMTNHSSSKVRESRYSFKRLKIEYDGNESHRFEGIINYLTRKSGGNVSDNGTVKVTSSSTNGSCVPKNSVDLQNTQNHFQSSGSTYEDWLMYDFIKNKVRPTRYSIRTRHDYDINHPRSWVIEGSNTGNENDWSVLDSHQNDETLKGTCFSNTFDIKTPGSRDGFRYIRFRQTGNSSGGCTNLTFSALEFFGALIENST